MNRPDPNPGLPRAALWDMDGTLLDSAELHWLAWQGTLAAAGYPPQGGYVVDEEGAAVRPYGGRTAVRPYGGRTAVRAYGGRTAVRPYGGRTNVRAYFVATFGQRNDTILRGLLGPDLPESVIARLGDEKEARYRELVRARGVEPLPGVRYWLARLRAEGWRQAIASAAPRLNVETILAALGIADYFGAIVSSEDVRRGKPDPQVFLLAAARVGVPPARCVVIEDSPHGIEAARRAGIKAIGVETGGPLAADYTVPTLAHLPEDAFERLVGQPQEAGSEVCS